MDSSHAVVQRAASVMSEWLTPFMDVRTDVDVVAALNKSSGMEGQESNSVSTAIGHLCSQLNQLSDASLGVKATTTPLISVQNLRVVYSVVEILWFWALKGAVTRASGFELPTAPLPKAILVTAKVLNCGVNHAVDNIEEYRLLETVNTIRRVVINDAFSGLMLHRNLDRLLVTYMVLAREISTVSETSHVSNPRADVVNAATVALQDLSTGPFASAVVTKLRSFTKGPPWLRDAALSTLSGILLGPGGLEIVLSGYLEGSLDGPHAEALQVHVAKLVTTPPASTTRSGNSQVDNYLHNIALQTRDLLLYGLFKNDKTLLRVCALIVTRLAIVRPILCDTVLLSPLWAPLTAVLPSAHVTEPSTGDSGVTIGAVAGTVQSTVYDKYLQATTGVATIETITVNGNAGLLVVKGPCITAAVEVLHALLTLCPVHSAQLSALHRCGAAEAMLRLYAHIGDHPVSGELQRTVEEWCVGYLRHSGTRAVPLLTRLLCEDSVVGVNSFHTNAAGEVEVRKLPGQQIAPTLTVQSILQQQQQLAVNSSQTSTDELSKQFHVDSGLTKAVLNLLNTLEVGYTRRLAYELERQKAQQSISDATTNANVTTSGAPSSSSTAKTASTSAPPAPGGKPTPTRLDSTVAYKGYEYIASELFLNCLSGFLQLDASIDTNNTVNDPNNAACNSGSVTVGASPAQCGLVMLQLQEGLPSTALLRDGMTILKLLKAFLEHHVRAQDDAKHFATVPTSTTSIDTTSADRNQPAITISSAAAAGADTGTAPKKPTRVLIEVIGEDSDTEAPLEESAQPIAQPAPSDAEPAGDRSELIECVLGLLAGILGMGQQMRPAEEEGLIRQLLPPLQEIAFGTTEETSIAQSARDVALMILSRAYHQTHPDAATQPTADPAAGASEGADTLSQLLARLRSPEYLFSDSPAMRAYGARILLQRIQRTPTTPSKALTSVEVEEALGTLLPLLLDRESFVYLSVLQVLRALGEHQPATVFAALLHSFASSDGDQRSSVLSVSHPVLPQARRAMVGEALALLLQRARAVKDQRPAYYQQVVQLLPRLVPVCLMLARQRPSVEAAALVQERVNLSKMRISDCAGAVEDPDGDGPDGPSERSLTQRANAPATPFADLVTSSSDVKNTALVADLSPEARNKELAESRITTAAAEAADQIILRQSAVALLTEALITAGTAAYPYLDDALDIACGVLTMEVGYDQSARAARRAAAYLAAQAILVAQDTLTTAQLLSPSNIGPTRTFDSFQRTYEVLQRAALSDPDAVVSYHASQGLYALQDVYERLTTSALSGEGVRDVDGKKDLYAKLDFKLRRFNQTMHFPMEGEENIINEVEVTLLCILNDTTERVLGTCSFVCTSGDQTTSKTLNITDHRGVLVGKVPFNTFYYSSAIKLGDKVLFKPVYEPNSKEYAFLLSRRLRHAAKATPVTFDRSIEHKLNNQARDLIARDFTIVSPTKKKPAPAPKPAKIATNAPETLTYNPGMTRNGAISDAARGRVATRASVPRTASKKARSVPKKAEPPKLRDTYMSVGYVKEKQWPERDTGATERNLYRLHQASEMKLQILQDIANVVKQRNIRTQAKQEAIRRQKQRAVLQESKIKRVLAKREAEIQLLKGTLTHLRLTSALQDSGVAPAATTLTPSRKGFSRLSHLLYPSEHDSTYRGASPYTTRSYGGPSTPAAVRARPSSAPPSARSASGASRATARATPRSASSSGSIRRRRQAGSVSFADTIDAAVAKAVFGPRAPLYNPLPDSAPRGAYDARARRPKGLSSRSSGGGYGASNSQQQGQSRRPYRPVSQEELTDQLSEAFDMTFTDQPSSREPPASNAIAQDWLASARASINEYHRPEDRTHATTTTGQRGATAHVPAGGAKHSPEAATAASAATSSGRKKERSSRMVHNIPGTMGRPTTQPQQSAQHSRRPASSAAPNAHATRAAPQTQYSDTSEDSYDRHRAEQADLRNRAAPSFLNSLVDGEGWEQLRTDAALDNTVSSIAVGDIPYFPPSTRQSGGTKKGVVQREEPASPGSVQSSDSLEDLSVPAAASDHPVAPVRAARGPSEENISNLKNATVTEPVISSGITRLGSSGSINSNASTVDNAVGLTGGLGGGAVRMVMPAARRPERTVDTRTDVQKRYAKQQFQISPTGNSGGSSKRRSAAELLARNRQYTQQYNAGSTSTGPAGPGASGSTASSAVPGKGATVSQGQSEGTSNGGRKHPGRDRSPERERDDHSGDLEFSDARDFHDDHHGDQDQEGEAEGFSLSASLARDVASVQQTVQQLQERVADMKQQANEDRVPAGWKLKSTSSSQAAADATRQGKQPQRAPEQRQRDPEPEEKDIRIVFEEASSSSGEFDLVRHKEHKDQEGGAAAAARGRHLGLRSTQPRK